MSITPEQMAAAQNLVKSTPSTPSSGTQSGGWYDKMNAVKLPGQETPPAPQSSFNMNPGVGALDVSKPAIDVAKNTIKNTAETYGNALPDFYDAASSAPTDEPNKATVNNLLAPTRNAMRATGSAINTIFAPVGGAVKAVSDEIANSPEVQKITQNPIFGKVLDMFGGAQDKAVAWMQKHPEATKDLTAGATIALTAAGGEQLDKPLENPIKAITRETPVLDSNGAPVKVTPKVSTSNDALEVVKPKLTPTQEAAAKASGRGSTEGIFKTTKIKPTAAEEEMAGYAKDAGVSPKNTFDKNIQLMKDAQVESAQKLREGLQSSDAIWNKNEVKGALNEIEKPLTIKSDTTLNKLADNFQKAIIQLADTAQKKPEGLLDLRQSVDDLIDKEFPQNIYSKDTPVGQYVRKVRGALNDLTESKLPDGELPGGGTFKGELRRQHLLYNAIDNVADNAPKAGESAVPLLQKARNFTKEHPYITAGASAIGGEKILKGFGLPLP